MNTRHNRRNPINIKAHTRPEIDTIQISLSVSEGKELRNSIVMRMDRLDERVQQLRGSKPSPKKSEDLKFLEDRLAVVSSASDKLSKSLRPNPHPDILYKIKTNLKGTEITSYTVWGDEGSQAEYIQRFETEREAINWIAENSDQRVICHTCSNPSSGIQRKG